MTAYIQNARSCRTTHTECSYADQRRSASNAHPPRRVRRVDCRTESTGTPRAKPSDWVSSGLRAVRAGLLVVVALPRCVPDLSDHPDSRAGDIFDRTSILIVGGVGKA